MSTERLTAPAGKRSGILISTPYDGGPVVIQDTVMCCHCGRHWLVRPGSGKRRGICLNCGGITCGKKKCDKCVPLEQRLENWEAGRDEDYRPIRASVPEGVPAILLG